MLISHKCIYNYKDILRKTVDFIMISENRYYYAELRFLDTVRKILKTQLSTCPAFCFPIPFDETVLTFS